MPTDARLAELSMELVRTIKNRGNTRIAEKRFKKWHRACHPDMSPAMAFQLLRAGAIFIIFAMLWGVVIKLKVNRNRGKLLYWFASVLLQSLRPPSQDIQLDSFKSKPIPTMYYQSM